MTKELLLKKLYDQAVISGKAMRIVQRQMDTLKQRNTSPFSDEYRQYEERMNQYRNNHMSHMRAFTVLAKEETERLAQEQENISWMCEELGRFDGLTISELKIDD